MSQSITNRLQHCQVEITMKVPSRMAHWGTVQMLACMCTVIMVPSVNSQNWALNKLIPVDYNRYQVPLQNNLDNDTLSLNASITLNSFAVNEKSQSISTDLTLCLNWTDYRIQSLDLIANSVPGLSIDGTLHLTQVKLTRFDGLWLPIVYFRNALSASIVNTLNNIEYIQVWPDRKLLKFCTRMSITFLCRMTMANFPFDEQYCNFELESFEKAAQHLQIHMQPMNSVKGNSRFRVRNTYVGTCDRISSDQFIFQELTLRNATSNKLNCAFAGVRLVRSINYYVIRYYCPTFLMILISFASFWLPTNAWPARVMLTATVLLTLITTSQGAYNEVPSDDVVSLYWWLWGCQFFVYMCLAEFAFALAWVQFINDKKSARAANKPSPDGHYFGKHTWYASSGECIGRMIRFIFGPLDHYRDPQARNKVDYFARILYPIMLLVFVIVYIVATIPVWANKWRW